MNKIILVFVLLSGCVQSYVCKDICNHFEDLNCEIAKGSTGSDEKFGTEDDRSCELLCWEYQNDFFITFDDQCLATVKTCEEIEECR